MKNACEGVFHLFVFGFLDLDFGGNGEKGGGYYICPHYWRVKSEYILFTIEFTTQPNFNLALHFIFF
jgi:hypothetical protein